LLLNACTATKLDPLFDAFYSIDTNVDDDIYHKGMCATLERDSQSFCASGVKSRNYWFNDLVKHHKHITHIADLVDLSQRAILDIEDESSLYGRVPDASSDAKDPPPYDKITLEKSAAISRSLFGATLLYDIKDLASPDFGCGATVAMYMVLCVNWDFARAARLLLLARTWHDMDQTLPLTLYSYSMF
jgi:hypothetical protein